MQKEIRVENVEINVFGQIVKVEPSNCRWADSTTQNINKGVQKNNKSGYTGVRWDTIQNMWRAQITIHSNCTYLGYYISKEEAVQARDNYIIEHKLPHKLST